MVWLPLRVWQDDYREALSFLRRAAPQRCGSHSKKRSRVSRSGRPLYRSPGIELLEARQTVSSVSFFSNTLYITGVYDESLTVTQSDGYFSVSGDQVTWQDSNRPDVWEVQQIDISGDVYFGISTNYIGADFTSLSVNYGADGYVAISTTGGGGSTLYTF